MYVAALMEKQLSYRTYMGVCVWDHKWARAYLKTIADVLVREVWRLHHTRTCMLVHLSKLLTPMYRGPPKGTCYKKRKRESTSSADDTDAKSNAAAVTVSHHQASPSNAEVKLHMEPRNKKRRISELSHNNNVNSQAPFQVKQEQLLHDLFSSMNGATTSIQQPFAMTTNHPSVVGFHPFMLPTADMMQSFPMNILPAQQSSITTNMPLVSSVHNTPVMPLFPVKREVEEAEASNDCCVGDCDSGCDSNDGACLSLFEQQIESVKMRMEQPMSPSALALELTDLPDIEDLTVGMCMNTSCGANHNRSCLISDLDLLSDNQPILDDVDSLFNHSDPLFVSSEEPSSPLSLDTAFDLDLELGNVVSSGLNSDSYSAFPRSLSMQQFDEDFLLS